MMLASLSKLTKILLGLSILLVIFVQGSLFPKKEIAKDQVCFHNTCINVEVVQDQEDRRRGLQFRKSLDQNSGMLFIFPYSGFYPFWLKDTFFALDIIWMDHTRRVVHIAHNAQPCRKDPCPNYHPAQNALYVLEVNAGYAATERIQLGDRAEFLLPYI